MLHENANPNAMPAEYALTFRPGLTRVAVGQSATYGNDDLPNLRAAEVAMIVAALVDNTCESPSPNTSAGKIDVEILEGRVYPERSEVDRKARVHVLVFLNDQR